MAFINSEAAQINPASQMSDDYTYFMNKSPDRIYLSRSLETLLFTQSDNGEVEEIKRPFRIVSKIIECAEDHKFIKDGKEISLRITSGGRQQITAKFYEDTRGVFTLQIQRYTRESGNPHNTYFTFTDHEITTLYNFLRNIAILPLKSPASMRLDDSFVEELVLTREQAIQLLQDQPDLVEELLKTDVSAEDVVNLGYRREQLTKFGQLLSDSAFFETQHRALGANKRPEDVWQSFFEQNTWIFGYGLNYFFNSPLEGDKLEQLVSGTDFGKAGKRVDALLKTQGIVSALAFGEIKTHKTELLESSKKPYRAESWAVSRELAGGVAQVQQTVQRSIRNLATRTTISDREGSPTGEEVFLYHPKTFLVIGSLGEFETELGINEQKYSSFELFRRNLQSPEIITFDELYERARYIVESHTGDKST